MTGTPAAGGGAVLARPGVYCVDWVPGTDLLRGTCHCGAETEAEDPASMWDWLLAHPERHHALPDGPRPWR